MVALLCQDLQNVVYHMKEAEGCISVLKDEDSASVKGLKRLRELTHLLDRRAEDAEGMSLRNNLRLVGLPEGKEGSTPKSFSQTG